MSDAAFAWTFPGESPARRAALVAWTFTACLPQVLLSLGGAALAWAGGGRAEALRGSVVWRVGWMDRLGGVCLGPVILVGTRASDALILHEWGHFRQHLRLGPLYLLVVGIPSVAHAAWHHQHPEANYFHFYTEAWADHLGGVYDQHRHVFPRWVSYAWAPALGLAVVAITLRAYGPALGWDLTDADAWADVAWAGRPLADQLTVRLTGGVGGDNANFWRPAVMLQYWLLRRAFGWEALGYHVYDLGLHVVASLLAGWFVVKVCRLSTSLGRPLPHRRLATLVTLGFAAHPLAEEVVPAVARNIDLLLAVGFFGALGALSGLNRVRAARGAERGSWAWFLGLVILALGAKESAVFLLPATGLFVLLFRVDLPARARLREALTLAAPVAVLVGLYLWERSRVLGGVGGYYDADTIGAGDWLQGSVERGLLEPFAPAVAWIVKPYRDARTYVPMAVMWAGAVYGMVRSPHRRLALFAGVWFFAFVLLFGATGTFNRRVFYVPTLASVLLVAIPLLSVWEARSRWTRAAGGVLAAVYLATYAYGTPVLVRYPDWGESSKASEIFRASALWESLDTDTTVWLVDRPYRTDIDPRRFRLWGGPHLGLAHAAISYSIEAWARDRWPDRHLRVRPLTHWFLRAPVDAQSVAVRVEDGALVVRHEGGTRTVQGGTPFQAETRGSELWLRARKGEHPLDRLVVWSPEGLWSWEPGTSGVEAPR